MASVCRFIAVLALLATVELCVAFPKAAKKDLHLQLKGNVSAVKWMTLTLEKNAIIDFSGVCTTDSGRTEGVTLAYYLLETQCAKLLDNVNSSTVLALEFGQAKVQGTYMVSMPLTCHDQPNDAIKFTEMEPETVWLEDPTFKHACQEPKKFASMRSPLPTVATATATATAATAKAAPRQKRSVPVASLIADFHARSSRGAPTYKTSNKEIVCETKHRGVYALVFVATRKKAGSADVSTDITVSVEMKNTWGYLSALDYPNLVFYAVMTAVYAIYAFLWLLALMCQFRDLLRIQFWIGGVIALGMVEKVFFFSQYNLVNQNGNEEFNLLVTAELISAAKRTLARLLIVIIALGFGIVKPRLGPNLIMVIAIGTVYFTAASVEGLSRVVSSSEDIGTTKGNVTSLLVVLLDVGIIYYTYASITDTMRTLRLRRNTVKLSLYRHFSNAIIFAVVASCSFITWQYVQFSRKDCITDWPEIWLLDGFWHILFCFVLLAMMVLWRPSANNNRYAYSPLVDLSSNDEEPEQMPSDAFEGMKLRNLGQERKAPPTTSVDDDLKWVEENIPTSLVDAAVPVLMDSEDELNMSRFEVSKMQ